MVNLPFPWKKKEQLGPEVLVDLAVLLVQLVLHVP